MPSVVALVALLSLWMFLDAKITAAFLHRFGNCGQLRRPAPESPIRIAGPLGSCRRVKPRAGNSA